MRELDGQTYTLIGARLDAVDGRKSVALVHKLRNHYIDLFVWRAGPSAPSSPAALSARGFSVVTWTKGGLSHAATSDIDGRELAAFALLIRETASVP